ncbi:hypothetical protein COV20_02535 [Candidatus Woesearchaeota archaeon CG10_big_fil_rev_8_21_14_0_10_45_16]|nr:MAG: hypothetical protein COV20_02535 [Candidatus Woesearchaeota archaeon CG10_big_fil_rev_8_21_14_0_10_45_16]
MVEETLFRGVVDFLGEFGVYDVLLPFLLVFTIVFAILEKTKILGVERTGGHELTKKNLNSMVAIIIAFLVIASTQLVGVINEVLANIVLLLILAVCFLLLVGVFFGDKEFTLKDFPGWTTTFIWIMFIGIIVIFLNALDWLQYVLGLFVEETLAPILFILVIVGFIVFITWEKKPSAAAK